MSEYIDFVMDRLYGIADSHGIKQFRSKRMFGGHGIYADGTFFAIIADQELYFKVDKETQSFFEDIGSEPFTYEKNGKPYQMSYWRINEDILDDCDELSRLFGFALDAAHRKPSKKKK